MMPAALAALLLAAGPATPAPLAAAAPPPASITPALHLSVGTGYCDRPFVPGTDQKSANPCYLVLGALASVRYRLVEAGVSYEGRQPVDLLTLFSFRPPTTTVLGASAGVTTTADERWRLALAGEFGWRRYSHFAGQAPDWRGDADLAYAGLVGRAATGLKNPGGRTDRIEVTVAWRHDLGTTTHDEYGQTWQVGGWSFTMGVGVTADW
jgi:hypothetical protein